MYNNDALNKMALQNLEPFRGLNLVQTVVKFTQLYLESGNIIDTKQDMENVAQAGAILYFYNQNTPYLCEFNNLKKTAALMGVALSVNEQEEELRAKVIEAIGGGD